MTMSLPTNTPFQRGPASRDSFSRPSSASAARRRIDARRGQAEMLLSIATHDTARKQVHLTWRDLEEAGTHCHDNQRAVDDRPRADHVSLAPGHSL
jgi:hypothetical protein